MKNIEKYQKEITNHIKEYGNALECVIATVAGIRKEKCYPQDCEECQKKCLEWMYSEYNEPILSDDEKEIVKTMCDFAHKCGRDVIYVRKFIDELNGVYIYCKFENADFIESPWLSKHMFKGMENGRKYTLEDLGITCQTQKDS